MSIIKATIIDTSPIYESEIGIEWYASCCYNVSAIFVRGTTSNFPSVGLRFRDRRVTLSNANATLDGSFPRDYPAHGGNTT